MSLYDYTIYSLIRRNARALGDHTALICGEERISHRKYLSRVDRLAGGLWKSGLRHGDRVAVLSMNNLHYLDIYGAAARLGLIVVPLNWRLSAEEAATIIDDSAPRVLFVEKGFQTQVQGAVGRFEGLEAGYMIGPDPGDYSSIEILTAAGEEAPEVEVSGGDDFVILYTAAVEGRPRGARLTHEGLLAANGQYQYFWNLTRDDVHLALLPLYHVTALGMSLATMQAGGLTVILPKFDATAAMEAIQDHRVTLFGGFPPIFETLLEQAEGPGTDLSSLRLVMGLEKPEVVRRFQEKTGCVFWTPYGQSETSGLLSLAPQTERPGSAGKIGYLTETAIMDDYGNLMAPNQPGEIVARGPMVFKGYWNLPEDTAFTFRYGWHHTGDLGRIDEEGYLYYQDRAAHKELIKPGGESVYPAEVEKAVLEHPAVREVSVIGVPDPQWGEAVKAVCVLESGQSVSAQELIDFVAGRIARFKKPKIVVFVSDLPKAADGRIDRLKVKELYSTAA
jgi:acyl-CoA synthetase (AMP-forming)/AMP-acid ligase II